jgi:glucosamine-6-phosphate deaminase
MSIETGEIRKLKIGPLKLEVYPTRDTAGAAAAHAAALEMKALAAANETVSIVFATGMSQVEMFAALTAIPGLPWEQVSGFHLDDYIGVSDAHLASPRRYIREKLTQRVPMREFREIEGTATDPAVTAQRYAEALRAANPQLCLLGIGENGHLAFNDPADGIFDEERDVKTVDLSEETRAQLAAERRFKAPEEVATQAITLSVPAIFRIPTLIVTVPGPRKARAIRRTLYDAVSTQCPSTILRTHPDVRIYIDETAAAEI